MMAAGLALATGAQVAMAAPPQPFKLTNIHFETNEQVVYSFGAVAGMEETHDQTEGFQERVEPPIIDLEDALGCEPSTDAISLAELFTAWPAGPEITAPHDGDVVPHDAPLLIRWKKVTRPIIPTLGPIEIVGYHVVVVDVTTPVLPPGKLKTSLNGDVSKNETTFLVPKQYLEPNRIYEFEVLATEKGGNQTITEGGVFCTVPMTATACGAL